MTYSSVFVKKVALLVILACSLLTVWASPSFGPGSSANAYVKVQGVVSGADAAENISYFYLDIYKTYPDSRRELVRTGRQPGQRFTIYLELGYGHTLQFQLDKHEKKTINVTALQLHQAQEKGMELAVQLEKPSSDIQKEPAPTPVSAPTPPVAASEEETSNHSRNKEAATPPPLEVVDATAPAPAKASLPQAHAGKEESASIIEEAPQVEAFTEEKIRYFIAEKLDTPLPGQQRFKLSRQVFLYREMEEKSKVLARLSAGSEVEVLERTTSKWWMVAHKGHIGWIETELLQ